MTCPPTDTPFTPVAGLQVQTAAWKEPREVESVTLDIDEPSVTLYMGFEEASSEDDFRQRLRCYREWEWQIMSNTQDVPKS